MRNRLLILLLFASVLLLPAPCRAAQNAEVVEEQAGIHVSPDEDSEVLETLDRGSVIRISGEQRQGWYKVRLSSPASGGPFGWVRAEDIRPSDITEALKGVGIQLSSPVTSRAARNYLVAGVYGFMAFGQAPTALQEASGRPVASVNPMGFGVEAGYRFSTQWTLLGWYRSFGVTDQASASSQYEYTFTPMGLMAEYTYEHELPWKVCVSFGGGILSGTAAYEGSGGEGSGDVSGYWAGGSIGAKYYPIDDIGIAGNVGYIYSLFSTGKVGDDEVAVPAASLPFVELGLVIEF